MRGHSLAISTVILCMLPNLETAQDKSSANFSYEVVSVRPFKGESQGIYSGRSSFHSDVTLSSLIEFAFDVRQPEQISGIPHWADSERYAVQAKADDKTIAAMGKMSFQDQLVLRRQMCVAMLVDRFGLKFHDEEKQVPVYELVIAKSGPKLTKSMDKGSSSSMGGGTLKGTGMATSEIAQRLSGPAGRMIIDKTGLEGRFNVQMSWTVDDSAGSDDLRPSLFTAIQEQLGLRLVSSRATIAIVVIDALTKPSEN